ncbi:MAG: hypothetical protein QNJ05_12350 [Woeseiaceae bacterium]|nr:hypothetical protein [Woeseiaceae bacterium]
MPVEFIVNGDTVEEAVTAELIARSIHSLTGDGDSFAILARDSQVYIQTSGGPKDGFILEYRDGSEVAHYASVNTDLTADEVVRAMQQYLANDTRWKTDIEWESLAFESAGGGTGRVLVIGLLIVLVGAWLTWKLIRTT